VLAIRPYLFAVSLAPWNILGPGRAPAEELQEPQEPQEPQELQESPPTN